MTTAQVIHQTRVVGVSARAGVDECADPIAGIKKQFVDDFQLPSIVKQKQDPAERAVFRKTHGIVQASFEVEDKLEADYQVGIFKQPGHKYPAVIRFSSDIRPWEIDFQGTQGIGIKLYDVPGVKELPGEELSSTHDFILQNIDVFFVDTALDMCQFTRDPDSYLPSHPRTQEILNEMAKSEVSVITKYWSCLPYQFGSHHNVKYLIRPDVASSQKPPAQSPTDASYLYTDLKKKLGYEEITLGFFVQINDKNYPIDKATVPWDEHNAHRVATIRLSKQDIDYRGVSNYGENLSFSPWRALPEHKPLGSISDARKVVYKASADLRRTINGVSIGEPFCPLGHIVLPPPTH